ncbi:MAG: DEAD/DEAH box helicase [Candidatus Sericytochromatia bacterium]|nr:DEAD/DEAH box helicase [Candidatus Sericytochromatia bacterium]
MTHPIPDPVARFAARQRFPLDGFQIDAARAMTEGRSVLVSAPTGAGKTIVGEFAIFQAREAGTRCIYTTPLKALSNQKYRDLHAEMGDDVGLVTGDVVIRPHAPILIMTTEILRNMLLADPAQASDVSHVVLDEAHYMGSEGRGTVWEETIVFLPRQIQVVALSATIPNADELAAWVSAVHRPMDVISHAERPVPLLPMVASPGLERLFDEQGKLAVRRFANKGWNVPVDPVEVLRGLALKQMLPAIWFVFSRVGCEQHADQILDAGLDLVTKDEHLDIQARIEKALEETPGLKASAATRHWLEALPYGVACHHAGLLPPLKLLVERLFQAGLIKVVFATETLAAGINMPARTVVMSSILKRSDDGIRSLYVSEFRQMTGRAGRRGMDEVGYGVVLGSSRYAPQDVRDLAIGDVEPLRSRFHLSYHLVTNLTHRYIPDDARRIVAQSFASWQGAGRVAHLDRDRDKVRKRLKSLDMRCPVAPERSRADHQAAWEAARLRQDSIHKRLKALEKDVRLVPRDEARRMIEQARIGQFLWVRLPGRPVAEPAVLLSRHPTKSGDIQYGVMIGLPALIKLGTQHLVATMQAGLDGLPPATLDKAGRASYLQQLPAGKLGSQWPDWLRAAGVDPLEAPDTGGTSPELEKARAKRLQALEEVAALPCHTCDQRASCKERVAQHKDLDREARALDRDIDRVRHLHWQHFQKVHAFLEAAGYMRGREVLARGVALLHLRTQNELMAAEAMAADVVERLTPAGVAALASAIVAEPPRGRQYWRGPDAPRELHGPFRTMAQLAKDISRLERRQGLDPTATWTTDYAGLVHAWAEGAEWEPLILESGIDEGQLVRHFRLVIDMLHQFTDLPGQLEGWGDKARQAARLLDRDLIREVL